MPANVDKALLFKKLLLLIVGQALRRRLDTEARLGLDQGSTWGQFTALDQLVEVLIEFGPVLGVRDLVNVVAHELLELVVLHRFGEGVQLLVGHVELLARDEGVFNAFAFFFLTVARVHTDSVEILGGVRVHH